MDGLGYASGSCWLCSRTFHKTRVKYVRTRHLTLSPFFCPLSPELPRGVRCPQSCLNRVSCQPASLSHLKIKGANSIHFLSTKCTACLPAVLPLSPVAQRCRESQRLGRGVSVNGQTGAGERTRAQRGEVEASRAVSQTTKVTVKLQQCQRGTGTGTACVMCSVQCVGMHI